MATVKVRIRVREIDNVMTQFNYIKVYRSDAKEGVYSEITSPITRVLLIADQSVYEYIDSTAPTSSYWYKTSYYNSLSLLESSLSLAMQGIDGGLYCTLQDIRDENISIAELSDDRALSLIRGWQAWLERATGQFFTIKELSLKFDGDGSRLLQLPIPIISCTALYINDNFITALSSSEYVVYNRRGPVQDDRKNPCIKLKSSYSSSIYSSSSGKFAIGDQNIQVDGTWGYVEEDGSTPTAIKRAVLILVLITKEMLGDSDIDQLKVGKIVEEVTDRHRIQYADLYNRLKVWSATGITEVDLAIQMYRAPMVIDAPRPMGLYV